LSLSACQGPVEAVHVRLSEGWWIQVNRDGSGAYGFGTLPAVAQVEPGAFVFTDILEDTKRAMSRKLLSAETRYMAVALLQQGASAAKEQRLEKDQALLARLFETARAHTIAPANDIEQKADLRLKDIWANSPP